MPGEIMESSPAAPWCCSQCFALQQSAPPPPSNWTTFSSYQNIRIRMMKKTSASSLYMLVISAVSRVCTSSWRVKTEEWRPFVLWFVGVCTSRLLSFLSLLTASFIAIEFWIYAQPPLDVLAQVFQLCVLIIICWVENRISPHGQLYFHLVHVCCVNWVNKSFANIFDMFSVFSTTVVQPV